MFRRITEGLKGGILWVVSIAEVAAQLLLLVGGAPGCGRACPGRPLGGCWRLLDPSHAGETAWSPASVRLPMALGAGVPVGLRFLRGRAPSLGFALRVGGGLPPRRCACTVSCAPVSASALAAAAAGGGRRGGQQHRVTQRGGSGDHRIRRRRRRRRRSIGRRRLRCQRGCVAAQWGSESLLVLGQRLPRLLQRWRDSPRLPLALVRVLRFTVGLKGVSVLITA